MSGQDMTKRCESDWARVEGLKDEQIDVSEIPLLGEPFFSRAKVWTPAQRVPVTLPVDPDVLEWFKAQGQDFEQRMNAALRIYAQAHRQQ